MSEILYMSNLYVPTLKEDPADAEIASHKLLMRAGMIRKVASGIYAFLPLGMRVLQKVENIVREEMPRVLRRSSCQRSSLLNSGSNRAAGTIMAPNSCA